MKFVAQFFIICFFQFWIQLSFAQYKITFVVKQASVLHSKDSLFIAGNFNTWNPADTNFEFSANKNGIAKIVITLSAGNYEYKFTRGSWDKVETTENGEGISNRLITVSSRYDNYDSNKRMER